MMSDNQDRAVDSQVADGSLDFHFVNCDLSPADNGVNNLKGFKRKNNGYNLADAKWGESLPTLISIPMQIIFWTKSMMPKDSLEGTTPFTALPEK